MRKIVIIITALLGISLIICLISYRDIIFNLGEIKEFRNKDYLYIEYSELDLSNDANEGRALYPIEYDTLKFMHPFGDTIKNEVPYSFMMHYNEEDLAIVLFPQTLSQISKVGDEEMPNRIKKIIQDVYGKEVVDQDFNLLKKAFEITPNDMNFSFFSRKRLVANLWLLRVKKSFLYSNQDLYLFKTDHIQGFQIGSAKNQALVILMVYDVSEGEKNCYIVLNGSSSQADVNTMINTMDFTE